MGRRYKIVFGSGDSMTPTYSNSHTLHILDTERDVEISDVVAYNNSDDYSVIHRIVGMTDDNLYTKGDGVIDSYEVISYDCVCGVVVFSIDLFWLSIF